MGRPRIHLPPQLNEHFKVYDIPMSEVFVDTDFNCRGAFTYDSVADIFENIKVLGLQNPVSVQPWEHEHYRYRLLAGHRRFKVYELLKYVTIPAFVKEGLDERQAQVFNFVENLIRTDLNIVQEAFSLAKLYPNGVTLRKARAELNQSERWINHRLRVAKLPEAVHTLLISGAINKGSIDAIWTAYLDGGDSGATRYARDLALHKKGAKRRSSHKGQKLKLDPDIVPPASRRKRSKAQIVKMIVCLLDATIIGLAPRMGAYSAGLITREELLEDIRKLSPQYKIAGIEQTDL